MADSVQGDNDTNVKRRRWPYVTFGLVVIVVLYLVIFRLPEPRLTLDYLEVLIWPGLVAVVLYWLREPLRQKVAELLNIKAPGFEAQFVNNRRLQDDLTGPAAAVLADTEDSESGGPETEPDVAAVTHEAHIEDHLTVTDQSKGETDEGEPEPTPPVSGLSPVEQAAFAQMSGADRAVKRAQEKQAIEDIMRVSAWWGYDMAQIGFKTRPTPVVEWTDDDRPLIQSIYINAQQRGPKPDLKAMANRLEQEIRDLEAKIESPMTGYLPAKKVGERTRLWKLRSQLRTIDPDSPLGIE